MPPVSRREARKSALTLLYQWDVTERAPGELYEGEIGRASCRERV